jgi:hypothetical protein
VGAKAIVVQSAASPVNAAAKCGYRYRNREPSMKETESISHETESWCVVVTDP